ncbi:unnamed protein product [Rotaria sordida]|uniref:Uncharacterized protein n=1 Tax=Rotaria sordida TaxID=392033 RepID=A0A819CAE9_9BILA|nr:unnamed protein product [Rotaria sordida]CAF3808581.1 unnamed protein product [Rotaria sordida]
MYHRFTMKLIRNILYHYNIRYTHIKTVAELLVIGVENDIIKQQNEQQLPNDIFNRYHYYLYRRHFQHSS